MLGRIAVVLPWQAALSRFGSLSHQTVGFALALEDCAVAAFAQHLLYFELLHAASHDRRWWSSRE
jgi:hypothetical protein